MKFQLEGLTVYFPYEYIYPEQYKCAHAGCGDETIFLLTEVCC